MVLVAGVDCGATWTKGAIVRVDATEVKFVSVCAGGSTNPNVVGQEIASMNLKLFLLELLDGADIGSGEVSALTVGGSTPELVRHVVESVFTPSCSLGVYSDATIPAFVSPQWGESHVLSLVSGTGSMISRVSTDGVVGTAGGWGWFFGDEGSATHLGRLAVRAALRDLEGGQSTVLTGEIAEMVGGCDDETLQGRIFRWAYQGSSVQEMVRALAPVVVRCANGGDEVSVGIRDSAVRALVSLTQQVHVEGDALVVAGSVGCALENQLVEPLGEMFGENKVVFVGDGVPGALLAAMGERFASTHREKLLGQWESVRETLRATH